MPFAPSWWVSIPASEQGRKKEPRGCAHGVSSFRIGRNPMFPRGNGRIDIGVPHLSMRDTDVGVASL